MNKNNKEFIFNEAKHLYQLDGKPMTGCTTIIGILAKPALIPWAAKMATEYIRKNITKFDLSDPLQLETLLGEAKSAHTKRKTEAGTYGTETHAKLEEIIKFAIEKTNGIIENADCPNESIKKFLDWANANKVKFLETEKLIYSEEHFVAGTVDFVCEIDGQVWVGDFKTTGSGIYPEMFYQCAGYHIMLNAMGLYPNIVGYIILNLKESGEFIEKRNVSIEENKDIFLSCVKIYKSLEKIKSNI